MGFVIKIFIRIIFIKWVCYKNEMKCIVYRIRFGRGVCLVIDYCSKKLREFCKI